MSTQAKPISQVVKDFEQSLRTYRPSTRRVYVAGAKAALRAASLEFWQSLSATDLLASIGKSRRLLFPGTNGDPLGRAALHNALRRLSVAGERSSIGPITPEKIRAAFL